jgi:hypothetical protein
VPGANVLCIVPDAELYGLRLGGGIYWVVEVAVVEASAEGTIEGAAWMMTVLVVVEVRLDWSVAT